MIRKPLTNYDPNRDRSRDTPIDQQPADDDDKRDSLARQVGRRYENCTFDNYQINPEHADAMQLAVDQCRDYVAEFGQHVKAGRSIAIIGPAGTGKDHLCTAMLRSIIDTYGVPTHRVRYVHGLDLYCEARDTIKQGTTEASMVASYAKPHLLAISDPLPPSGSLSQYEQRIFLQIVSRRYTERRPLAITVNIASRAELYERMAAQNAGRILQDAIVVKCNWPDFRQPRKAK